MSEKDELLSQLARAIDRLHELNESSSHHLQAVINKPAGLLVIQLRHLLMLAQDLIDALENPAWKKP